MLRFAQRAVVFIFLFSALLEAQPPDLLTRGPAYADALARFAGTDGVGKDGPMSKLGFTLTLLYSEYRLFVETGVTGSFVPTDPLFSQLGLQDRVVVDMVASGDVGKFVDELRTMGFEHVTAFRHVVSALAPIEKLETLASLPALRMARAGLAKSRAGSVTSQGDPAMESDLLRPVLDGSGVTGPMPILFDLSDSPIMEVRPKPEIVGPDGGDNTFFGSDFEPNGFPNFFGTSAAAPHVAALAALLLELAPGSTPDEVLAALEGSAIDMGPAGFDDDSGFGLVNAVGAANLISPPLAGPPAPPAPDPVPPGRPTSPDPPVSSPDAEKNRVGQSYVRPVERKP